MATNRISVLIDVTVDKANRALKGFKQSVTEADGAVGKFKAGSASAFASLKANALPVAAAVGAGLVTIGTKAVSAASDLEESMNAVNVVFGDAAEGIHELGDASVESFGLSQRAFNEAAVSFAGFAEQVAGEGGDVVGVIDDLVGRATDFASVHNLELSDAMIKFQSGLAGETEALRRYSVDLSAAAVNNYALENGLVASTAGMTEAIKVQARYELLMRETNDVSGDFANTQGSLANSTKTLNGQMENLYAELGTKLTPVVADAVQVINDLVEIAETGADAGNELGISYGDLAGAVSDTINPAKTLYNILKGDAPGLGRLSDNADDAAVSLRDAARATEINAERTRDYIGATDAATESTDAATDATADATESQEDYAEALRFSADALEDQYESLTNLIEAQSESVESTYAVEDAFWALFEANKTSNEAFDEATEGTKEWFDAQQEAIDAADAFAAAKLAEAEATATASGETLTATERADNQTDALLDSAAAMTGPARRAVLGHIARLNDIPDDVMTLIEAALERDDIDEAERLINETSRTREVAVEADAVHADLVAAEIQLNNVARDRTSTIRTRFTSTGQQRGSSQGGIFEGTETHSGGVVKGGIQSFAGLRPDEVPAILQKGEAVLTPEQQGAMLGAGRGGGNSYSITVNALDPQSASRAVVEAIKVHERRNGPGWRS